MQANPNAINLTKPSDYKIFILLSLILGVCLVSNSFLGASFWLDECISFWVSSHGVADAISRSWHFQGQSPLYYVLLSFWIDIVGTNEVAIRSFSLLCLALTCVVLFRWIKESISLSTAFVTCFIFICQDPSMLALSARPYALGILFCILAVRSLTTFVEKDHSIRFLIAFTVYGTLAIYSHYFAAFSILAVVFTFLLLSYSSKPTIRKLIIISLLAIACLCLPLLPQLELLRSKANEIAFAPCDTINRLF